MTEAVAISRGKEAAFPAMLAASIFAHVITLILVIALPQILPHTRREPFGGPPGGQGNVMTVDFRLGPPSTKAKEQQEPAPAKYISKLKDPEAKPLESKTTLPAPEKPKKKEQPTDTKTQNVPLSQRKTEGPYSTGKDTSSKSGKFGLGAYGPGQGGPGGYGTGAGVPFPFPWYIDSVITKIELNWAKPYISETAPKQYYTVVYFVITRAGGVTDVKVEQSSGVPALDRSAESAILGATPFPPLPNQWTDPDLPFRLTFQYTR